MENKEIEFESLIMSIINDGNMFTLGINDPDNEGVFVDEWTMLEENGMPLGIPELWLSSQVVNIEQEIALEIARKYVPNTIVYDESTGDQIQ